MPDHRLRHLVCKAVLLATLSVAPITAQAVVCATDKSDPDGDGFGYENNQSCTVVKVCTSVASDPDGDGWGWENGRSCVMTSSSQPAENVTLQCIDSDGDGWGWDGTRSCKITGAGSVNRNAVAGDITDVVLITGQSNALGPNTEVVPGVDDPANRVFAWTDAGWQVADLRQVWDLGWHPRTTPDGKHPHNNFGLHFGKYVAGSSNRVVAFILVSAAGKPIATWDKDKPLFRKIKFQVETALSALPHLEKISGILWHQGENDWKGGLDYQRKLAELINNFRQEAWFEQTGLFICGETYRAPVNADLDLLNADGDIRTACVSSAGLSVQDDQVHFDANGLRLLGQRYGSKYIDIQTGDTSSK